MRAGRPSNRLASTCLGRRGRSRARPASPPDRHRRGGLQRYRGGAGANLKARQDRVPDEFSTTRRSSSCRWNAIRKETARLIHRARDAGARVILNLAPAVRDLPLEALKKCWLIVVNEQEADFSRCADRRRGGRRIAVGDSGAACCTPGPKWRGTRRQRCIIAAHAVSVDTTAAGDCFVGVLAAASTAGSTCRRHATLPSPPARLHKRGSQELQRQGEIDAAMKARKPAILFRQASLQRRQDRRRNA
ncbi:MAG: hypothetical protein H6872_14080 [Methylobacteriaceae bacterium]|nr:hypothetical protein [Methylobacteriaceae bacterium]